MKLELLFPLHLRETMKNLEKLRDLEEIRVRIGQPIFLYTGQRELILVPKGEDNCGLQSGNVQKTDAFEFSETVGQDMYEKAYRITEQDLHEMQNYISNYSLYAWQEKLKNGFLTIQGGHRIGLAGGTANQNGRISGISYLTFFNIRVAHERIGCADKLLRFLYEKSDIRQNIGDGANAGMKKYNLSDKKEDTIYNTLIISSPGKGKTTLLRDCIRSLSYGDISNSNLEYRSNGNRRRGFRVGLVDERSEIAASYHGIPQNDVGPRTDVLDGCNKPEGIQMLLRTMAPEIIAVDELGTGEDFKAVEQAAYSGCKIIGTVHAGSIKELQEKPILKKWCEKELFERFIFIEKGEGGMRVFKIYDNRWKLLC